MFNESLHVPTEMLLQSIDIYNLSAEQQMWLVETCFS